MKIGVRTPNLKKSLKARTTGRMKRAAKRAVNPLYGKKGMGWINDPKRAAYNKVYNKTTVSAAESVGALVLMAKIIFFPITFIYYCCKWFMYKPFELAYKLIRKMFKSVV